jgi:carboxymethylenebutenolidase
MSSKTELIKGKKVEIKPGFSGYLALPDAKRAPGMIVIQEIFGVNSHIREVADLYAASGYVALAPDVFWRAQPGVELTYSPEDIQKGIELAGKSDKSQKVSDLLEAVKLLKQQPQCAGRIGAVGYCMGGYLSYLLAANAAVDAAVCYYGGGIAQDLDDAKTINCPVMMHFGEKDAHIPLEAVGKIRKALEGKGNVSIFTYDADHGFNCDQRGSYDRQSAMLAFGRTTAFFDKALG